MGLEFIRSIGRMYTDARAMTTMNAAKLKMPYGLRDEKNKTMVKPRSSSSGKEDFSYETSREEASPAEESGERDSLEKKPGKKDSKNKSGKKDSPERRTGKKDLSEEKSGKKDSLNKKSGKKGLWKKESGKRDLSDEISREREDLKEISGERDSGNEETSGVTYDRLSGDTVSRILRDRTENPEEMAWYGHFSSAVGKKELQNAVVWAEVLGPPVAKKNREKRMERLHGNRSYAGRR